MMDLITYFLLLCWTMSVSSFLIQQPKSLALYTQLNVLVPVGPFSPFRSAIADRLLIEPTEDDQNLLLEMSRIQASVMTGQDVDAEKANELADRMQTKVDTFSQMAQSVQESPDFQTQEVRVCNDVYLEQYNMSTALTIECMQFQVSVMRNVADDIPIAAPSPELVQFLQSAPGSTGSFMQSLPEPISSPPFDPEHVFENELIEQEYRRLCEDHQNLIDFGGTYGNFDRAGKLVFLDQMDAIRERWEIFYQRFALLGQLNPVFAEQSCAYLEAMGMTENEYYVFLERVYERMRREADQ